MEPSSNKQVLIIGAGIAGLALAQILRANDIPFEIYERDATWTGRNQGYSIGLLEAIRPLTELLPKDLGPLHSVSVSHGTTLHDTIALYNLITHTVISRFGGFPPGHPSYVLRANRPRTRDYLWQHLNVHINKRLSHYTEDRDSITAHFEDGSSATGSILVGADGSRSKIRAQMLEEDGPGLQLSKWQSIQGELDLPRLQYEEVKQYATTAVVGMGGEDLRFVWTVREHMEEGGVKGFWGLLWKTEDPKAEVAWLSAASKKTKWNKVLSFTSSLPPFLKEMVSLTGPEGLNDHGLTLAEFVPPRALPRGRATLIGDACHTMIPFRGAGGNTACLDACDLAKILIKGWKEAESAEWMLKEYEDVALPRGREMVLSSRKAGESVQAQEEMVAKGREVFRDESVVVAAAE